MQNPYQWLFIWWKPFGKYWFDLLTFWRNRLFGNCHHVANAILEQPSDNWL